MYYYECIKIESYFLLRTLGLSCRILIGSYGKQN